MNIEDYREYCLSLGADVEEKLPFQKFKNGEGVLVFYVMGHMFSFFDCNDFSVISLKCQPERIEELKAQHDCIGNPYNESPKHWIGLNPNTAADDLLQELTRNSYEIVKAKYASKRGQKQTRLDSAEREHTRPRSTFGRSTDGTQELKACPFQLDDYAKFASELDTIIDTLKNKEK